MILGWNRNKKFATKQSKAGQGRAGQSRVGLLEKLAKIQMESYTQNHPIKLKPSAFSITRYRLHSTFIVNDHSTILRDLNNASRSHSYLSYLGIDAMR